MSSCLIFQAVQEALAMVTFLILICLNYTITSHKRTSLYEGSFSDDSSTSSDGYKCIAESGQFSLVCLAKPVLIIVLSTLKIYVAIQWRTDPRL